ncbi:MAG: hypothetical protein EA404_14580 [Spirochaetaceae bacterium]|nr:MAG: hypothetical protein EA404_14580 [Spirochaetaceae bacterium]
MFRPHWVLTTALILAFTGSLYGYNPPAGGEEWRDIVSPTFQAGGADVTAYDAILGGSVNPAAAARREQLTVGLGYSALIDAGAADGFGHIVALGGDLPTTFGVLGLHTQFVDSQFDAFDLGTLVRIRGIYAREILPGWLFGASGNVTTGQADRGFLGVSGAGGIIQVSESVLGLSDVRWGLMFDGIGIGYNPHRDDEEGDRQTAFPSVFTPAAGLSFNFVETDDVTVRFAAGLSAPRFQNLRANAGLSVGIQDIVTVQTGTRLDVRQLGEDRATHRRGFLPSVGIELNIGNLIARNRSAAESPAGSVARSLRLQTSFTPLTGDVFAVGGGAEMRLNVPRIDPPQIALDAEATSYIAPTFDGVNDELLLPVTIHSDQPLDGYRLVFLDDANRQVREIRNIDERPETVGIPDIVRQIRAGERSVPVPETLVWDARSDDGRIVPDGRYRYYVEAWDNRDNRARSRTHEVIVDTVPPELEVHADEERVFTPIAETGRRSFEIRQRGEAVPRIEADLTDIEGRVIRSYSWSDEPPGDIVWDGTDSDGEIVSDGVYRYRVTSVDRAGNRSVRTIDNIVVSNEQVAVFVTADLNAFSPDGDGTLDTVTFSLLFTTTDELESWTLEIADEGGGVVRSWSDSQPAPPLLVWDGGGAPDGVYRARLTAEYAFDQSPQSLSERIVLDTTPPELTLELDPQPFSPDGDGVDDELDISLTVRNRTPIENWRIEIFDPRGELFHAFGGSGAPTRSYRWNGVSSTTGRLVDSATSYRTVATVTDIVGNRAVIEDEILVDILVIRDGDRLFIRIGNINFEPNTARYIFDDTELTERNLEILDRLAVILSRFEDYAIRIEGHAVNITGTQREHEQTLIPLSTDRAAAIREALIERGIDGRRLSVLGKGGSEPLVPHTDLEERWRNRRVEFVLIR